jgi:hypothetical protein
VDFIGHKRRCICRRCYFSAKAAYDRMTADQKDERNRKLRDEFEKFMRDRQ